MKLDLGILYKNGLIVNHRSLLKVFLNPILRYFGYEICSNISLLGDKLLNFISIRKCEIQRPIKWSMKHNECDFILKKRTII